MTSLLQFHGKVRRHGVRLEFCLVRKIDKEQRDTDGSLLFTFPSTEGVGPLVPCPVCGKSHPRIYTAWRKPRGLWGHWVVFAYNGKTHAPDLSIPIQVETLPRDAKPMSDAENAETWHSS